MNDLNVVNGIAVLGWLLWLLCKSTVVSVGPPLVTALRFGSCDSCTGTVDSCCCDVFNELADDVLKVGMIL